MATLPSVVSLHGGGPSSKATTEYLGEFLSKAGIATVRIDFSGHGESTGTILESSLEKRKNKALQVIRSLGLKKVSLVGSSMGGYIASALVDDIETEKLVFFCPAAYSAQTRRLKFEREFTDEIRRKDSFLETDIPSLLVGFTGKALLFMGENDQVIPKKVVEIYKESLRNSEGFRFIKIPACPHPIHRWIVDKPEERKLIESEIAELFVQKIS